MTMTASSPPSHGGLREILLVHERRSVARVEGAKESHATAGEVRRDAAMLRWEYERGRCEGVLTMGRLIRAYLDGLDGR